MNTWKRWIERNWPLVLFVLLAVFSGQFAVHKANSWARKINEYTARTDAELIRLDQVQRSHAAAIESIARALQPQPVDDLADLK